MTAPCDMPVNGVRRRRQHKDNGGNKIVPPVHHVQIKEHNEYGDHKDACQCNFIGKIHDNLSSHVCPRQPAEPLPTPYNIFAKAPVCGYSVCPPQSACSAERVSDFVRVFFVYEVHLIAEPRTIAATVPAFRVRPVSAEPFRPAFSPSARTIHARTDRPRRCAR